MTDQGNTMPVSHAKDGAAVLAELATTKLIDLSLIDAEDQVRTDLDPGTVGELAISMQQHGQLQPIVLRPKQEDPARYIIIAGERRYRAASMLGWSTIEAKIRFASVDDAQQLQLIENIQREDLNLADTAAGVYALVQKHKGLAAVADLLGKSIPWVSKHAAAHAGLSYRTRGLLEDGRTEDLELLMVLSQLESAMRHFEFADLIEKKLPTREQARKKLAAVKEQKQKEAAEAKERQEAENAKRNTPAAKRQAERVRLEAIQREVDAKAWHAFFDAVEDKGQDPEQLVAAWKDAEPAQLTRLLKEFGREYDAAYQDGKNAGVDLVALARWATSGYHHTQQRTMAAYLTGAQGMDWTLTNWAKQLQQLQPKRK